MRALEEKDLVRRAGGGDEAAFAELYRRHEGYVRRVIGRFGLDRDSAQEAAQDAWVAAHSNLGAYRGDASFRTWLHRIATNAASSTWRRRSRLLQREEELQPETPAPCRRSDALLRSRLDCLVAELPPRMRRVLLMHDVWGMTHAEIAAGEGIHEGTSKSQLFRARRRLRALIVDRHPDLRSAA